MSEFENQNQDWEKSAEEFVNSVENTDNLKKENPKEAKVTSLGKAKMFLEDDRPLMADIGYKNIPLENLPSRGMFYPDGTQIAIRAATVNEIRHWSTIDEDDIFNIDDMLNYVIEKCCRIKIPGSPSSWKDIKDIDRFYLIFAIREFTFKNGENKIYVKDSEGNRIEVRKEMIKYFQLHEKLQKYYDSANKNILLRLKNGEEIAIYMPSIGVSQFIKNYVKTKQQQGQPFDQAFIKFAPFLFKEWRTLNQTTFEKEAQQSSLWSLQKISVLSKVTEYLSQGVSAEIEYQTSSGELITAPLNIEGGIKSIFLISDIFDELV